MEALVSVCLGIALSAACGLRVFVPWLVAGLASRAGLVTLSPGFSWAASTPALLTLSVATLCEVAAYHIPWLDHLLDAVATPSAVVAGILASASVMHPLDPSLKWTLAVIAGGGAAGATQALTVAVRHLSTLTTGGLGNPLVASAEAASAFALSLIAILAPVAAVTLLAAFLFLAARRVLRGRRSS